MTFSAGLARAVYDLDASRFYAEIARIKREYQALRAAASQPAPPLAAPAVAPGAAQAAQAQAAAQAQVTTQTARAQVAQTQAAIAAQRLVQAQFQAAAAGQRQQTAAAQTAAALQRQATATAQAQAAALRLAAAQERAAKAPATGGGRAAVLPRTIAGLSNEAATFAKGLLGAAGVSVLAQFGLDAGKAAVSLERTRAVLQNVLGSQQRYNEVANIATTNQRLLGGSLESNLATLQQFAFIANRTGGSIEELNRVAQLLAAVNPAEGLEGAGFALSELAAGDVTSIVERFNLSRQAVTALKNEAGGDLAVLLAGVTELLAQQGVTSETLAAALTENSLAYRGLAAEAEKAKIKVGEFAAEAGRLPALGLAGLLRDFNAIADIGNRVGQTQAQIVAGASSFTEYQAAAAAVNGELAKLGTALPPLSEAQFLYVKALEATGVASADAIAQAVVQRDALARITTNTNAAGAFVAEQEGLDKFLSILLFGGQTVTEYDQSLAALEGTIFALIAADSSYIPIVEALIASRDAETITNESLISQIQELARQQSLVAAAQAEANAEAEAAVPILDTQAQAAKGIESALSDAAQAAYESANAGGTLEEQALAAARALFESGNAGVEAGKKLAGSAADVDILTLAYLRNLQAQQQTGYGGTAPADVAVSEAATRASADAARQTGFRRDLEREITRATGDTAAKLALVNAELARARPFSENQKKLLVEQAQLQQQLEREREAERDKAASKAESAAKKAAAERERLAEQEQRERERRAQQIADALERIEDRTADHYVRLRQAQEDYATSANRREEDFQRERQRLLAEGRIAEARLLAEEFQREQRRAAEDDARKRQRQNEDVAGDISRIRRDAELDPTVRPVTPTTLPTVALDAARQAQAQAALAVAASAPPVALSNGATVRIEFAPIQLIAEGRVLAQVAYPHIERRLVEDLTVISATAPPTANIAGGGRP